MALVPWSRAYWSSRQLATVLLSLRTTALILSSISFCLFFTSLIILRDQRNQTELYRCVILSLGIAFAYSLSLFTRSTPPPFWRAGWCVSGILQGTVYIIILRRNQERFSPYYEGYNAYWVNIAGVIVMAVNILFMTADGYVSYRAQQDKILREPLLKNFLLNRIFIRPSTDYRLHLARAAQQRQQQGQWQQRQGSASGSGAIEAGGGAGGAQDEPLEVVIDAIELEIQERQFRMINQQIHTQQRENWFLSPRVVSSPDFNLADHNVALEPLPLYEPPADGVYVPPSPQQHQQTTAETLFPASGLPRPPPPAALAGEPAPPSYDTLASPTDTHSPSQASWPQSSTTVILSPPPTDIQPQESSATVATATLAPASSQVPPHLLGGQLPPAYDDVISPPSAASTQLQQPAELSRIST